MVSVREGCELALWVGVRVWVQVGAGSGDEEEKSKQRNSSKSEKFSLLRGKKAGRQDAQTRAMKWPGLTYLFIVIIHFKRIRNHPCHIPQRDRMNMLYRYLPLHHQPSHIQQTYQHMCIFLLVRKWEKGREEQGRRERETGIGRRRNGTNLCAYTQDVAPETDAFVTKVHPTVDHDFNH